MKSKAAISILKESLWLKLIAKLWLPVPGDFQLNYDKIASFCSWRPGAKSSHFIWTPPVKCCLSKLSSN